MTRETESRNLGSNACDELSCREGSKLEKVKKDGDEKQRRKLKGKGRKGKVPPLPFFTL